MSMFHCECDYIMEFRNVVLYNVIENYKLNLEEIYALQFNVSAA